MSRLSHLLLATALPMVVALPIGAALNARAQSPAAAAPAVEVMKMPPLPLAKVAVPDGKTLDLNIGLGSGAFRSTVDEQGVIWSITDRGPNIDCADAKELTGRSTAEMCAGDATGKIFPMPAFTPTLYKLRLTPAGAVEVLTALPLKGTSGKPITGLPNPLTHATTEVAYGIDGKAIAPDPSGLDTEAVVRLADGTFWLAEEYGPSLVEVAPDGTIRRRLVPAGVEADLAKADYPVDGILPAILARRQINRGIENLALSPDGAFLYVLMQSPLANPDAAAFRQSPLARLVKVERATGKVVGEYLYGEDDPTTFRSDNARKPQKQSDVRMSDMVAVGTDRLIVLERISKTTKLYLVDLKDAVPVPAAFDDPKASPALEQLHADQFAANGLKPLAKTLILDSDDLKDMPSKIESVAVLSDRDLVLVTDSDFGIDGATTQVLRLRFPTPVLR